MAVLRGLRKAREAKYLSLAELSGLAGVAKANINRIELGKQEPHPRTIRKLAAALKVDPDELVSSTD